MAIQSHSFFLLCLSTTLLVQATPDPLHNRDALPFPITAQPLGFQLRPRQAPDNPGASICGYRNGNLDRGWKAPEGSTCFLDHTASYFGWCNALFTKAEDCTEVARACVDSSTCSGGCGKTGQADLPTITCTKASSFCYSNLLVTGDLTYTALGCDLERRPLIYSPAAGILDSPPSVSATPTDSLRTSSRTSSTPTTSDSSSPNTLASTGLPSQSANSQSNLSESPTSTPAPTTSSSTNAGAIAGGVVGGLAVLAMAGLAFYFIRRRSAKNNSHNEPAELGPSVVREGSLGKYAYHSELPAAIAAYELPPREPAELHGDAIPANPEKYGY